MITHSVSRVIIRRNGANRPTVILVLDGKACSLTPAESAAIRADLQDAERELAIEMALAGDLAVTATAGAA